MLSHSLPSSLSRSLNGEAEHLPCLRNLGQFSCVYCPFTSHSPDEINSHRWEVHPLLARRKQHLVTSSPQNRRKRPNSESSEEGKDNEAGDGAPRKKASPLHVPVMSRSVSESVFSDMDLYQLRSCSDNEINEEREMIPPPSRLVLAKQESTSEDAKISLADCRSDDSSTSSGGFQFCLNEDAKHDNSDLHTLAKAAVSATPIPHDTVRYQPKCRIPADSLTREGFPTSFPSLYFTKENFANDYSGVNLNLHQANSNQYSGHPYIFTNNGVLKKSVNIYPFSHTGFPQIVSITAAPAYSIPNSSSIPTAPQSINKLQTLTKVATKVLSESSSEISENSSNISKIDPGQHQRNLTSQDVERKYSVPRIGCSEYAKKSAPHLQTTLGNSSQCFQVKKQSMDEHRVRSLEEALSKIDCCDPEERTNLLPYKCPDGKWRMVRTKCFGGAWLVHIPGALHPSVYVPNQQKYKCSGILDDWLKEKLTSTGSDTYNRQNIKTKIQGENITHRQFCASDPLISSTMHRNDATSGNCGGAIKSLLLGNTAS